MKIENHRRYFLFIILTLLSCLVHGTTLAAEKENRPPNVLFIISDDQGFSDFGFTEKTAIRTPVLDRLAAESAVFENFVVAPACAPFRASFFTGYEHLVTGVWGVPMRNNLHPDVSISCMGM